jgi:uncharacterized membrane protein YidH (DUF202 family)
VHSRFRAEYLQLLNGILKLYSKPQGGDRSANCVSTLDKISTFIRRSFWIGILRVAAVAVLCAAIGIWAWTKVSHAKEQHDVRASYTDI